MSQLRVVLLLAAALGAAACTDEGEGSVTGTGVGLVAIPWWVIVAVLLAVAPFRLLRRRGRR